MSNLREAIKEYLAEIVIAAKLDPVINFDETEQSILKLLGHPKKHTENDLFDKEALYKQRAAYLLTRHLKTSLDTDDMTKMKIGLELNKEFEKRFDCRLSEVNMVVRK